MRSRAEIVRDELLSLGHAVELTAGPDAGLVLAAVDDCTVRVLVVEGPLDAKGVTELEQELDPRRIGNVLVVALDRSAPAMAARIESFARAVRRAARPVRLQLTVPGEAKPQPKTWLPAAAAALVIGGLAIVGLQYGLQHDPQKRRPEASVAGIEPESAVEPGAEEAPMAGDPITISVQLPDSEIEIFEEEEDEDPEPRRRRRGRPRGSKDAAGRPPAAAAALEVSVEDERAAVEPPLPDGPMLPRPPTFAMPDAQSALPVPGEERVLY